MLKISNYFNTKEVCREQETPEFTTGFLRRILQSENCHGGFTGAPFYVTTTAPIPTFPNSRPPANTRNEGREQNWGRKKKVRG